MQTYFSRQTAFIIKSEDNVATTLGEIEPGVVTLRGNVSLSQTLTSLEDVKKGYKLALRDISLGEPILKFGIQIGVATTHIREGECVHLHNISSMYDARSKSYDTKTAIPKDRHYDLDDKGR